MKKRRLKVFALGAALVFFAALLPVTALAVEEEDLLVSSGGLEDGLHGSVPENDNSGAPPEFGELERGGDVMVDADAPDAEHLSFSVEARK